MSSVAIYRPPAKSQLAATKRNSVANCSSSFIALYTHLQQSKHHELPFSPPATNSFHQVITAVPPICRITEHHPRVSHYLRRHLFQIPSPEFALYTASFTMKPHPSQSLINLAATFKSSITTRSPRSSSSISSSSVDHNCLVRRQRRPNLHHNRVPNAIKRSFAMAQIHLGLLSLALLWWEEKGIKGATGRNQKKKDDWRGEESNGKKWNKRKEAERWDE